MSRMVRITTTNASAFYSSIYYRTTDGQVGRANKLAKLELVIAQGCEESTKKDYQSLKDNPPVKQQNTDE